MKYSVIQKRFMETYKLIHELEFNLEELTKHGFIKVDKNGSVSGHIWINKKLKLVVKQPYLSSKGLDERPAELVHTLMFYNPHSNKSDKYILIQPLVNVDGTAREEAYIKLKSSSREVWRSYDIHSGNVGMFLNKPVIIDF